MNLKSSVERYKWHTCGVALFMLLCSCTRETGASMHKTHWMNLNIYTMFHHFNDLNEITSGQLRNPG